ncbi:MAG: hypothetical protein ACRD4M_13945 [Candidatus Acidiferrales bacterium]
MTKNCFWGAVLVIALGFLLATPATAQNIPGTSLSNGQAYAIVVGVVAVVVVVAIVVIHKSKNRTITGCVVSEANGMNLTNEKDKRIYALSGNTAGITPGDRVTLQGKKIKSNESGGALGWQTKRITQDFGACHP